MRSLLIKKPQIAVAAPTITPTLAWYDATNAGSIAETSGSVTSLADLSGNSRTLTPVTAFGPGTGSATINGLNAFDFFAGGVHRGLGTASITVAQPITALVVVTTYAISPGMSILGNTTSNPALLVYLSSGWTMFAGAVIGDTVTADSNPHVLGAVFNGASSSLYLDGTQINSGDAGSSGFSATPLLIGSGATNNADTWRGLMGEALLYSSALSSPDYAAQQAYLKAKWGTP